jgi:hypothetical protein
LRRSFSFRAISFLESVSNRPSQAAETPLNGGEIGQETTQPALVHEEHPAALRLFGDDVLSLPLGPDEQNRAAVDGKVADEIFGFSEQLDGLAEVDDVDAVSFSEDVLLHLRVPAFRLVAEVHAGFQ